MDSLVKLLLSQSCRFLNAHKTVLKIQTADVCDVMKSLPDIYDCAASNSDVARELVDVAIERVCHELMDKRVEMATEEMYERIVCSYPVKTTPEEEKMLFLGCVCEDDDENIWRTHVVMDHMRAQVIFNAKRAEPRPFHAGSIPDLLNNVELFEKTFSKVVPHSCVRHAQMVRNSSYLLPGYRYLARTISPIRMEWGEDEEAFRLVAPSIHSHTVQTQPGCTSEILEADEIMCVDYVLSCLFYRMGPDIQAFAPKIVCTTMPMYKDKTDFVICKLGSQWFVLHYMAGDPIVLFETENWKECVGFMVYTLATFSTINIRVKTYFTDTYGITHPPLPSPISESSTSGSSVAASVAATLGPASTSGSSTSGSSVAASVTATLGPGSASVAAATLGPGSTRTGGLFEGASKREFARLMREKGIIRAREDARLLRAQAAVIRRMRWSRPARRERVRAMFMPYIGRIVDALESSGAGIFSAMMNTMLEMGKTVSPPIIPGAMQKALMINSIKTLMFSMIGPDAAGALWAKSGWGVTWPAHNRNMMGLHAERQIGKSTCLSLITAAAAVHSTQSINICLFSNTARNAEQMLDKIKTFITPGSESMPWSPLVKPYTSSRGEYHFMNNNGVMIKILTFSHGASSTVSL
jgi:hypothetical protein